MNGVSAIIVTRGDVDVKPIAELLPLGWQVLVYDNAHGWVLEYDNQKPFRTAFRIRASRLPDVAVYGRFAALAYADNDLIYVQDDDCIVSDPAMIALAMDTFRYADGSLIDCVVCNMPQEFRHAFYDEHALCGFGAAFPRTLPERIFQWFNERTGGLIEEDVFNRTCDIVFTALANRVLVDYPVQSLPYAHAVNRMWKQTTHVGERTKMLQFVKDIAEAFPAPHASG